MRILLALRCFFLILFARRLPLEARALLPEALPPAPVSPPPAPRAPDPAVYLEQGAVRLLALLQREGRLVDFLEEDITNFSDAQIGGAVRDIHRGCRQALAEHIELKPVIPQSDNANVRIEQGFDASAIRLVGEIVGQPPFTGTLAHPGWRAVHVHLPEVPASSDASIIAPAEVEVLGPGGAA